MMETLYLGGGLFNAGERLRNLYLEKFLKEFGYKIILPQREALKFFNGESFDIPSIVESCFNSCANTENIFIGNLDGADSDSGTCVEYGIAIKATGRAIVYRTDFRTAEEKEVGVNAMLKAKDTIFIYEPCYFTDLSEVDEYYRNLARKIHEAIQSLKEVA